MFGIARLKNLRPRTRARRVAATALLLVASTALALFSLTPGAYAEGPTGYHEQTVSGGIEPDTTGTVAASCPTGDVVVGGGYQLSIVGHSDVTASEPASGSNNTWEVTVGNSDPSGALLTVTVTAVCVSDSIPGYEQQTTNVTVASGAVADVTATCSSGNVVVGGGFTVPSGVENFASQPTDNAKVVDNEWTTTVDNTTDGSLTITTVALCVSGPLPGYEEPLTTNSSIAGGSNATVTAPCSRGNLVLGGGAQVETPAFVELGSEAPTSAGKISSRAWSASVMNTNEGTEEASVVAICATPGPTVTTVSPPSGPAAGGTTVTITGTNIGGATAVNFGGTGATSFVVDSATQITATSPSGADVVDVTVTTPGGTSAPSSADQFQYVPAVTGVSPSAGSTAGGTTVTITGGGFTGATGVDFGTLPAADFTVNDDGSITASAPPARPGTVHVTVTTPGGTSTTSTADQYTYDPVPTVTAVSPKAGPVTGGTPVTITGTGFVTGATVAFGSKGASNVSVVSGTKITATAPAGSAGTIDVKVTTPGGTSATGNADKYTYDPIPSVTGLSPNAGPVTGGTSVTIAGTGFVTGATAKFGSNPATNVKVINPTHITATSPPAANTGAVDVTVTTPGGTSPKVNADKYTYSRQPVPQVAPAVTSAPSLITALPAVQSSSAAGFTGSVNPGNLSTVAFFEYGLDSKYGVATAAAVSYAQSTPAQSVGSDSTNHKVSASVSGLVPNALYHVRLVARNSAGTTFGPDETFLTLRDVPPPPPVLGVALDVKVVSGLVLIKPPPGKTLGPARDRTASAAAVTGPGFVPLTEARQIPVGSQIDARLGSLQVVSAAIARRKTQAGVFGGALFQLTQARAGRNKALTTLSLTEGAFPGAPSFAACTKRAADGRSSQAHAAALSRRILQTLRASEHGGRFRTRGRYAAATVRGTKWDTIDRCDGTLTVVHRGIVQVIDLVRHVVVNVHAGHSYLAKARKHG